MRSPKESSPEFAEVGVDGLKTLDIDHVAVGPYIRNTLAVGPQPVARGGA